MSRNCGIYQIRNLVNNKKYIGQSTSLRRRKIKHFSELRNNSHINQHLQRAFSKYGEENFTFEIIEICDESTLNERESHHWSGYNWDTELYNLSKYAGSPPKLKGEDHPHYGKKFSKETRNKMSVARTGEGNSQWGNRGEKNHNYGKPMSEAVKRKISEANSGKGNGMFGVKGTCHPSSRKVKMIDKINGNVINLFDTIKDGAKYTGGSSSAIVSCCKGRTKTSGGYRWEYA